jgi:hypothetical protein
MMVAERPALVVGVRAKAPFGVGRRRRYGGIAPNRTRFVANPRARRAAAAVATRVAAGVDVNSRCRVAVMMVAERPARVVWVRVKAPFVVF